MRDCDGSGRHSKRSAEKRDLIRLPWKRRERRGGSGCPHRVLRHTNGFNFIHIITYSLLFKKTNDTYNNMYIIDMEFGHRLRTNTAQRLEKMEQERKRESKIKHIKWEYNPNSLSLKDKEEYFKGKDFKKTSSTSTSEQVKSLFSEQLENCPDLPKNPFAMYAKFDGNVS